MEDQFECSATCRCKEFSFRVRYREKDEDIIEWMKLVQIEMGKAHSKESPLCQSSSCDLKLPMPAGTHGVGMRVTQ